MSPTLVAELGVPAGTFSLLHGRRPSDFRFAWFNIRRLPHRSGSPAVRVGAGRLAEALCHDASSVRYPGVAELGSTTRFFLARRR